MSDQPDKRPPTEKAKPTTVQGDVVGGDKFEGDKVMGNKIEAGTVIIKADTPEITFPIIHLPFGPNAHFTGREAVLAQLHTQLHSNSKQSVITQAIAGLGGVGKTQVALEYIHRHRDQYDLIWWLDADNDLSLTQNMMALGQKVGVVALTATDRAAGVAQTRSWLSSCPRRWLLLVDNADHIDTSVVYGCLPPAGNGHVVITSRNPNWGGIAPVVALDLFSETEAIAFLVGKTPTVTEKAEAAQLADLLGYLPLALEHARAYVAASGCSLSDYADYFKNERHGLWADAPAPVAYDQKTITTTWTMAFAEVRKTAGAAALLNLCCFLAPDDIPLTLLTDADEALVLPDDLAALRAGKRPLDTAIAALRRYSLVQRTDGMLSLHRLVQTVARDQMPTAMAQTVGETAVVLLKNAWPFTQNDMSTWAESNALLPHLLAVIAGADDFHIETPDVATLNGDADFYLSYIGNSSLAKPYSERALAIDEKALGPDHPSVATRLNNLGTLLKALGDYEAARPFMERALAIDEKALGPNHPDVAIDLNNLGLLLQAVGDYAAARPYLERALVIFETRLGADHPNSKVVRGNLEALLAEMGQN